MNEFEFEFDLVLSSVSYEDETLEDRLHEAGCDDATLSFRNAVAYLDFTREANSLEEAVISAINDAERAGAIVARVMPDNIVSASEISRRIDRSRESIRKYIEGERGSGGFPAPASGLNNKSLLWSWVDVSKWLSENKLISEDILKTAIVIAGINMALSVRRNKELETLKNETLSKLGRILAA